MPKTRESVSLAMRFAILRRDKLTCQYCGARAPDMQLHVDHVVPVVEGGSTDPENLITACIRCNLGKGSSPATTTDLRPQTERERALEVDLGLRGRELSWFEWAGFVRTNDPAIKAVLYVLCAAADAGACFTQRVGNIAHHAGLSTGEAIRALRGMEATGLISGPEDDELAGSTVFVECDDLVATGDLRVDWTFFRTGKQKPPYALSDYLVPAAFSTVARIHG